MKQNKSNNKSQKKEAKYPCNEANSRRVPSTTLDDIVHGRQRHIDSVLIQNFTCSHNHEQSPFVMILRNF